MSHGIFPTGWATCPHTKKIKLKLLVLFLDEVLSLKNKSCVIEKIPVPALCFVYSHSYNNYVKITSTGERQIKLTKILIKQKHVIRILCKWGNSSKTTISRINVELSPSKKIFFIPFNDSPSKMMKNAFEFILKALFGLKIFKLLSWLF